MNHMSLDSKIFIAGHRGLVGSSLVRGFDKAGYHRLLLKTREELDLTCQADVHAFFAREKPDYVLMAAAKVGGIVANDKYCADFGYDNQIIQLNILHAAFKNQVKRLVFLGSSCLYPRDCEQPMSEKHLLTGPLEPTNKAYALAKISGISLCESYNKQYGTQYMVAMPTNLYGPNDNYDLEASHVIPALMRKIHEAKQAGKSSVEVWGSGTPRREFMHSDDLTDALLFLLNLNDADYNALIHCKESGPLINIGYGKDLSIKELVHLLCDIIGYEGTLMFDTSKPDGTPQKLLNCKKLYDKGWLPKRLLKDELQAIYRMKFLSE